MAEARQQGDWVRQAIPTAWVINRNGFTKQPVQPLEIIPAQFRPPPEPPPQKTPEEIADENRRAWFVLDKVFGGG